MAAGTSVKKIEDLEPKLVWEIFRGIASVPRPSKKEQKIRAHVMEWAKRNGLKVREEKIGNLIIEVPGTKGHEKTPVTVLQGHLDMVCESNSGTKHDFDREGIRLKLGADKKKNEQIVQAEGTTLGADNGMGVALAMAAAVAPNAVHGPLEILLTIDEEAGMSGAKAITPKSFAGRRMINLDSEEDDAIYIGCAGGCDTNLVWNFSTTNVEAGAEVCRVVVDGLRGGHSGGDIHENRGNAIKLLVRTLLSAGEGLRISEIQGGRMRNAIPREASAVVAGPKGIVAALKKAAKAVEEAGKAESYEDGLRVQVKTEKATKAISANDSARLLSAMTTIPSGVLGMHPKIAGLVQTSNNLSTVLTEESGKGIKVAIGTLSRSSSGTRLSEVTQQIASIGQLTGAKVDHANAYPGWEPNPESPTLQTAKKVYKKTFGEEPKVMAIHAGLECGIIGERVGKMDMISFGPHIEGAHSPDERVYTASVPKMWKYLTAVLKELA